MTETSTSRNGSLDWMRVVSILYIVGFWHLLNYSRMLPWYESDVFYRITALALSLFVLMSGYLAG